MIKATLKEDKRWQKLILIEVNGMEKQALLPWLLCPYKTHKKKKAISACSSIHKKNIEEIMKSFDGNIAFLSFYIRIQ